MNTWNGLLVKWALSSTMHISFDQNRLQCISSWRSHFWKSWYPPYLCSASPWIYWFVSFDFWDFRRGNLWVHHTWDDASLSRSQGLAKEARYSSPWWFLRQSWVGHHILVCLWNMSKLESRDFHWLSHSKVQRHVLDRLQVLFLTLKSRCRSWVALT